MIYAYIRVSTDRQSVKNQKYEILRFADEKKIHIDKWIEETISGTKKVQDRKLGELLQQMNKEDMLIITEISRLGRSLMEVMSILHDCMERDIKVFTTKERYELGNNMNSKVLAFAFSISAEIERNMITVNEIGVIIFRFYCFCKEMLMLKNHLALLEQSRMSLFRGILPTWQIIVMASE